MKYALLNTSNEVIRTQDFADTPPTLPEAKGLRWLEYVEASQPAFDPMTQRVEAALPVVGNQYTKAWAVVALDAATIAARYAATIPASVSMRQARLALLGAGLLSGVNAAIAAIPGAQGDAARIEWEYAQEVRRDSPLIALLMPSLGLTSEQVDAMFVAAAGL